MSTTADKKDVQVISDWRGGVDPDEVLEKIPSRIAYASENNAIIKEDVWGSVRNNLKAYGWFKLLLDEKTKPQELDDPLLRQCAGHGLLQLPAGKTAEQVAADYLHFLYLHTMKYLSMKIGEVTLAETPITFNFTLPATWSPAARDATRRAASAAGFENRSADEFLMITEPEAAAIAAIRATSDAFPDIGPFEQGSCFIVLDMGGGTIDLVTYKILKLEPLKLDEACVGDGNA